jgi:hypothetical protein
MENMENTENTEPKNFSRRSRAADHRNSDSRSANSRPPLVFGFGSQFNIDEETLYDKRYEFGWTPYIVRNEDASLELERSDRRGWEDASADDYPQMKRTYKRGPLGKKVRNDEDDRITQGGMVFRRRPIELKEQEEQHYDEKQHHDNMVIQSAMKNGPSGARVSSHSRRKVTGLEAGMY